FSGINFSEVHEAIRYPCAAAEAIGETRVGANIIERLLRIAGQTSSNIRFAVRKRLVAEVRRRN
ncbi:hypothetical protein, partial [Hydrogenophaga sp.]|uniref:hypothetical protein n=1 Tax=Hydrogenophaga sp. TaxID=1904254 RepID=UPI002612D5CE